MFGERAVEKTPGLAFGQEVGISRVVGTAWSWPVDKVNKDGGGLDPL